MHGAVANNHEVLDAIKEILEYSNDFNSYISSLNYFKPYSNLKGVFGRLVAKLNQEETILIMKGLGFHIESSLFALIKKDFKFDKKDF